MYKTTANFLVGPILMIKLISKLHHHRHHWQNNSFWAIDFLRRIRRIASGFHLQNQIISLASNPQSGGQAPCIYVPQWQGGPVKPLVTWFSFRRFLRLAGVRRNYCNPPSHEACQNFTLLHISFHVRAGNETYIKHYRHVVILRCTLKLPSGELYNAAVQDVKILH
jgi:hypothetical protein